MYGCRLIYEEDFDLVRKRNLPLWRNALWEKNEEHVFGGVYTLQMEVEGNLWEKKKKAWLFFLFTERLFIEGVFFLLFIYSSYPLSLSFLSFFVSYPFAVLLHHLPFPVVFFLFFLSFFFFSFSQLHVLGYEEDTFEVECSARVLHPPEIQALAISSASSSSSSSFSSTSGHTKRKTEEKNKEEGGEEKRKEREKERDSMHDDVLRMPLWFFTAYPDTAHHNFNSRLFWETVSRSFLSLRFFFFF